MNSRKFTLFLTLLLIAAGGVRAFRRNWDDNTHLHPDERYLTMVSSALQFPSSLKEYWDTESSPLNPMNSPQYGNYVYGTLPPFVTRAAGAWLDRACGPQPSATAQAVRGLFLGTTRPCPQGMYTGYGGIHLVGRTLSTLADLAALLALVLLARTLYGEQIALLAGALYGFAVLPIQHAHFFVVDSFATVFVMWALCFIVWAVHKRQWGWLLLAGLSTGLAVACKISVWPLAGMVGLAGILQRDEQGTYHFTLAAPQVGAVTAAGVLAFLAFRVAQPYTFSGPGFFGLRLNPHWVQNMRYIRDLVNGKADTPPGHQWTNRTPILFPWRNMVFWGLGLPLGLSAWLGWGAMGWRLLRRRWLHLLPWVWGTGFFLYQATQWVKSMRYLLPVYPVFVLFAAWLLGRLAQRGASLPRKSLRLALQGLPWLILGGTVAWAMAFMQIYAHPITRITASRWMFAHIPTAATLHLADDAAWQVPVQPDTVLNEATPLVSASIPAQADGLITSVTLNKVNALGVHGARKLKVALVGNPQGQQPLGSGAVEVDLPADGTTLVSVPLDPPLPVTKGETVYLTVSLVDGSPIRLQTSVVANEHWDDPLPLRIDGKDPFRNWYRGLSVTPGGQMNLYDNDTPEKRAQILNALDEADVIVLSSNRLYASIPRLPLRYPMTIAYYRALFNGQLGFKLVGEFVSFPALGPCQFPDQESPFPIPPAGYSNARPCSVPYPPAEEAFSVYDHPRVLIFAKTAAYSRQRASELLPLSLLDNVQRMTPYQATHMRKHTHNLLLTPRRRAEQEAGGTWSVLFHRQALYNRHPALALLLWWLMLTLLGWMAFPWLYAAFPALRHRGYGIAKIVGLLTWAYPAWLLASVHLVPHTGALLWGVFAIELGLSGWWMHAHQDELRDFLREHGKEMLYAELLFALLYLSWAVVRYLNPDLWHPVVGGEKPMDFAYLNAVIKSTWFPPYDPWFAGGYINYYYFGFVLIGSLTKALGIIPSIAYNLAIPSLFAMMGSGAFVLASNLAGGSESRGRRAGLLGTLLVLLLGNLGEVRLLFRGFEAIGNVHFESMIPGYPALVSALVGLWKVAVGNVPLQFRPEWWYWDATRIIPGQFEINEFPLFTFLYGDLHAHMMAYPITQIALAVALQWGLGKREGLSCWPTLLLGALSAGALRATNTWDYPTFVGLMSASLLFNGLFASDRPYSYWRLVIPLLLVALAELLFRPFSAYYETDYTKFVPWTGTHTPLGLYLIMHGQFLFPLSLWIIVSGAQMLKRLWTSRDETLRLSLGIVAANALILLGVLLSLGAKVAWAVIPLGTLTALLVLDPRLQPRRRLLWLWISIALAISLMVELFVLKGDLGRMNTVFKFYLQVWQLLGLGAAVALDWLFDSVQLDEFLGAVHLPAEWGEVLRWGSLAVLFGAALYPALAIPAKVHDRWDVHAPHTLDGAVYMDYVTQYENNVAIPLHVDAEVIRWMQDHIVGSPTIIEAQAEREYLWGNRISIYTGLPSVAAWRWHQVQQRQIMPPGTVEARQADIRSFYNTGNPELARELLRRYQVRYVILTPYEQAYMMPEGLPKFSTMVRRGWLKAVYQQDGATVYEVLP